MKPITRRDVLKTGLLAPAATAMAQGVGPIRSATHAWDDASGPLSVPETLTPPAPGAGRERLLLDFGWRFHLGNANDAEKDFHYGSSWTGNFEKTGNFLPAATAAFDDSDWSGIDLPHDWAVDLPFVWDDLQKGHGYKPLGRRYPETSVGWYRRTFTPMKPVRSGFSRIDCSTAPKGEATIRRISQKETNTTARVK